MDSFNETILGDFDSKVNSGDSRLGLELRKCSSFEEILMENHKNVLI